MSRKPRPKSNASNGNGHAPTTALIRSVLPEGVGTVEVLQAYGHDPMAELIKVAKGEGGVERNTTAVQVCEFLDRLAEKIPQIATQCGMLKAKVERDLMYHVDQREIDRINLALLEYQHATLKPVEQPKVVKEEGEGTFAHAVATVGAKIVRPN